jgi:hypothetical protein
MRTTLTRGSLPSNFPFPLRLPLTPMSLKNGAALATARTELAFAEVCKSDGGKIVDGLRTRCELPKEDIISSAFPLLPT